MMSSKAGLVSFVFDLGNVHYIFIHAETNTLRRQTQSYCQTGALKVVQVELQGGSTTMGGAPLKRPSGKQSLSHGS